MWTGDMLYLLITSAVQHHIRFMQRLLTLSWVTHQMPQNKDLKHHREQKGTNKRMFSAQYPAASDTRHELMRYRTVMIPVPE
jgi:hypothetical protein